MPGARYVLTDHDSAEQATTVLGTKGFLDGVESLGALAVGAFSLQLTHDGAKLLRDEPVVRGEITLAHEDLEGFGFSILLGHKTRGLGEEEDADST